MFSEKLQTILKVIAVVLVFCLVGVGIYLLDKVLTPKKGEPDSFSEARTKLMGKEFEIDGEKRLYLKKNVETYLIAGVDVESEDREDAAVGPYSGMQADFILLLVVDKSDRKVSAINVSRDTYVTYKRKGYKGDTIRESGALALSFSTGDSRNESAEFLRGAVSGLFFGDQPYYTVDHYFVFTMDSVAILTDYVNANATSDKERISIDFKKQGEDATETTIRNFISEKIDPTWDQTTDSFVFNGDDAGKKALDFVRKRMDAGDGTNVQRMERQTYFFKSLMRLFRGKAWDYNYLFGALQAFEEGGKDVLVSDYGVDTYAMYEDLSELFGFYQIDEEIVNLSEEPYGVNVNEEYYDGTQSYFHNTFYIGRQLDAEGKIAKDENGNVIVDATKFEQLIIKTFYREIED